MQGRLAIFLTIVVVLIVLVALNAAAYVRVEEEADTELSPNRSTANAGPTGTRALYDFLAQSDYKVVRWTDPVAALLNKSTLKPATFVVVGTLRTQYKEGEAQAVRHWVEEGGRLVIIDRQPDSNLLPSAGIWYVTPELVEYPSPSVRPEDVESMTAGIKAVAPAQPTLLTRDVEQIAPSRFAARLHIISTKAATGTLINRRGGFGPGQRRREATPTPATVEDKDDDLWTEEDTEASPEDTEAPAPTPEPSQGVGPVVVRNPDASSTPPAVAEGAGGISPAPVEHFRDGREGEGALLVDYAYGRGRIIILSDPFIVSNGGLSRADNLQLAVNIVSSAGAEGIIAFDEYHQGLGAMRNRTLSYFAGTPVVGIFAQAAFILIAVMWSRGRRFARPLPAPRIDRRSNLEFVASMAELQQRARAYDLAIENVYTRTRRALARYAGTPATVSYREIAARVAARSGKNREMIETLMRECEDAIAGAPITARQTLALVARLRELERDLGIRMRAREIRQAEKR